MSLTNLSCAQPVERDTPEALSSILSMNSFIEDIHAFRKKWKLDTTPRLPLMFGLEQEAELIKYQRFFKEELLVEASAALDPNADVEDKFAHIADALADGLVFMIHLSEIMGIGEVFQDVWDEVHRSNLSKGDGENLFHPGERPGTIGKMIKGPSYTKANVRQFFNGTVTMGFRGLGAVSLKYAHMVRDWFVQEVVPSLGGTAVEIDDDPDGKILMRVTFPAGNPWVYAAFRSEVGDHWVRGGIKVTSFIRLDSGHQIVSYPIVRQYSCRPGHEGWSRFLLPNGKPWEEYASGFPANTPGLIGAYHFIKTRK